VIYTFYSYKGGVGRSMALANVGKWLALQGVRVVMIDWDLEAPGLESFFSSSAEEVDRIREELGVIDLLTAYKTQAPTLDLPETGRDTVVDALQEQLPPLKPVLVPIDVGETSAAPLWLLPAGWRRGDRFGDYATAVQTFDWRGFYADYHGEAYFEWMRRQLLAPDIADIVLIDSRTGVTEMGGVCTRQLADVVVSFCVPNIQNLEGVADMVASFKRPDIASTRGRDLEVVVVPTRIDQSEIDRRNLFEREFRSRMDGYTPFAFQKFNRQFWDLKIPYISKYAYEEVLAIGAPEAAEELTTAYQNLAAHLALLGPDSERLKRLWDTFWRSVSAPPVAAVGPTLFSLPPQNSYFTGRDELLAEMRANLEERPVALHGLAGCGKSALALEYAYLHGSEYDVVWWIDAKDKGAIRAGLNTLAASLSFSGAGWEVAREWLERNERWLLILDDAPAPAEIAEYLPRRLRGHVLVTSRNPNWGPFAAPLHVGALTREEAIELLAKRTGEHDKPVLDELGASLGDLPLALEQAAGYVQRTGEPLREYLALLELDERRLLMRPLEGEEVSIGELIWTALAELEAESEPAHDLLHVCSFLGLAPVPINLLATTAARWANLPPELDALRDRFVLRDLIATLRRRSLIEAAGSDFSVHRLVQAVVRESGDQGDALGWAEGALRLTIGALPYAAKPATMEQLVVHVSAAADHVLRLEGSTELVAHAMEVTMATAPRQIGDRNPLLAAALRSFAPALVKLGNDSLAEAQLQHALEIDLEAFGEDDPRVVADFEQFGAVYFLMDRTDLARVAYERALSASSRSMGKDHPRTDAIRGLLAGIERATPA